VGGRAGTTGLVREPAGSSVASRSHGATTESSYALQRYGAEMLRALTATLTMTSLALAACGGGASEDLPPLTTAKGDGLDSYEVGDGEVGNRVCEDVQENVPDELKGKRAVKIVLPDGSLYTTCELPP
jgi:hypothetical protein